MGSLLVGVVVAGVAVVVAWPAARYLRASGSWAGWAVLGAPVLLPPLVLGDGLAPWLLAWGISGHVAIAVAHLPTAIAYAALGLATGFGADTEELDATAALLGASPQQRLRDVLVPACRGALTTGWALAFTVSWSQYATSLTVGGGTPMLPLVLVPYVRSDPQVAATLALVFVIPPGLALAVAARSSAVHRRPHRRAAMPEPTAATTAAPASATKPGLVGCRAELPIPATRTAPGTNPSTVPATYGAGRTGDSPAA
ncbi:MAG: ABC transporter permease [Acidimicrobiales bacterium]